MSLNDGDRPSPANSADNGDWFAPGKNNVILVYILYLASLLSGITVLIGLIVAYMNRGRSDPWIDSHYTWAIRTFWIGLLYTAISTVLVFVLIGLVLYLIVGIWLVVRVVIGLQKTSRNQPIDNPKSWII